MGCGAGWPPTGGSTTRSTPGRSPPPRKRSAAVSAGVRSLVIESRLPEPGQVSSGGYEGDGYVIVRHPDTAVVADALWGLITGVRVELG